MVAGDHVPEIPFKEFVGKTSGAAFKQYGPNCVNVGVTFGVIVMVMVVTLAHCPAFGVNVYTVGPTAAVLMTAGDQVPMIGVALFELVGNTPGVWFWQYGPNCVNVGVTFGDIMTVIVVTVPHWFELGVKVYTDGPNIAVLMVAGNQVPVIPLLEVAGRIPGVEFWQ
jgi:hypothetical protein